MKNSTRIIERRIVYTPFVVLCLAGFLGQSCSKSEIALNPEEIAICEENSKKWIEASLKDSLNRKRKDIDMAPDTINLHKQSDIPEADKHIMILNTFNRNNADTLHLPITIIPVNPPANSTNTVSQPSGGTNNSTPNNPVVNVPPVVSNKSNDLVPPVITDPKKVSDEITVKTSQGVLLHPPKNLLIGLSKAYPLATDTYTGLLTQMPGGENEFWFYGKTNQYSYPTGEWVTQANGYSTIDLPTHAINARAGIDVLHPEYNGVICKIEYTIKDADGKIVMFCKDTKGGFHPTFIPNERGNNHPKESQRFLPYGIYTVEFKNITDGNVNAPIRVTYNRAGGNATMGEYFDATVNNQQTITFEIRIFEQEQEASMFKLNCNMVP